MAFMLEVPNVRTRLLSMRVKNDMEVSCLCEKEAPARACVGVCHDTFGALDRALSLASLKLPS